MRTERNGYSKSYTFQRLLLKKASLVKLPDTRNVLSENTKQSDRILQRVKTSVCRPTYRPDAVTWSDLTAFGCQSRCTCLKTSSLVCGQIHSGAKTTKNIQDNDEKTRLITRSTGLVNVHSLPSAVPVCDVRAVLYLVFFPALRNIERL